MQTVIVYGGSGFIGSHLVGRLESEGYFVVVCDQVAPRYKMKGQFVQVDMTQSIAPQLDVEAQSYMSNPLAVINLAGKSIFGEFTDEHKKEIYDSRVVGTRRVVAMFAEPRFRPRTYITASGTGYYGNRPGDTITEGTGMGSNFLASVTNDWEAEARRAEAHDVRTVIMRQGVVLGDGGMLAQTRELLQKGLGATLGSGKFFFPWIHVEDCVGCYLHAITTPDMRGVYNLVTGEPIQYRIFFRMLMRFARKAPFIRIPLWAMRWKMGREFVSEMTVDQKVIPERILTTGYEPVFTNIADAVRYEVE